MPQPSGSCRRRAGRRSGRWRPSRATSRRGQRHHVRLRQHRHLGELEARQRLASDQSATRRDGARCAAWHARPLSCSSRPQEARCRASPPCPSARRTPRHSRPIVGRRSSPSISALRAGSIGAFMPALLRPLARQQRVIDPRRRGLDRVSGTSALRREAPRAALHVRQLAGSSSARAAGRARLRRRRGRPSPATRRSAWHAWRCVSFRSSCSQVRRYASRGNSASRNTSP